MLRNRKGQVTFARAWTACKHDKRTALRVHAELPGEILRDLQRMLLIRRIGEVVFKLPCAKPQRNPRHLQTALHSVLTRPLFLGGLSRLFLCASRGIAGGASHPDDPLTCELQLDAPYFVLQPSAGSRPSETRLGRLDAQRPLCERLPASRLHRSPCTACRQSCRIALAASPLRSAATYPLSKARPLTTCPLPSRARAMTR